MILSSSGRKCAREREKKNRQCSTKWQQEYKREKRKLDIMDMSTNGQDKKLSRKFVPFVAGIACGIIISILFCLSIALFAGELQGFTNRKFNQNSLVKRDLTQLPDDVVPEAPPVPDPDWKAKLNPAHIPATMQQEFGLKKEVYIAILGSSNTNLDLISLNQETWAKDLVNSDVDYSIYAPTEGESDTADHFIRLPDTPATGEATSLMVYNTLSDICDQHIDTHRLFFIVGSRSYVNVSGLLELVRKLDESVEMLIGKGVLMQNVDRLFYNDVTHHCPINPGFLVTRRTLQRICPHIPTCRKKLNEPIMSRHHLPSLNLARCMKRFLNLSCTSIDNFHELTEGETSELTKSSTLSSFYYEKNVVATSFTRSSSLVSNLLHRHHVERLLNETIRKNKRYLGLIDDMDRTLVKKEGTKDDRLILGRKGIKNKFEHSEVVTWNRYVKNDMDDYDTVYSVDDSRFIRHLTQSDYDMLEEIKAAAFEYIKKTAAVAKHGELGFGDIFQRIIPGIGFEYLLELQKDNHQIGSIKVERSFNDLVAIETTTIDNSAITIVLPIQENAADNLLPFMQMFEQSSLSSMNDMEKIALLVVIFPSTNKTLSRGDLNMKTKDLKTLDLLSSYKHKHKKLSLKWIDARTNLYSYIGGITMAISALPKNRLVCSMTTSVELSTEFFYHARANTKQGKQLYFPIPYQASNKTDAGQDYSSSGFWRSFDFDYFCGYQSDLVLASDVGHSAGFSSGDILYKKSISAGLNVFRAPEPALVVNKFAYSCSSPSWSRDEQGHCLTREKQYRLAASTSRHR